MYTHILKFSLKKIKSKLNRDFTFEDKIFYSQIMSDIKIKYILFR